MDQPDEEPEQIDVQWNTEQQVGDSGVGTVAEATVLLGSLGADLASLAPFAANTPIGEVPKELWLVMLGQLSPQDVAVVAQVNQLFHQLVRQGNVPVADARKANVLHAYNAAQLAAAMRMGEVRVAVHPSIDGAAVATAANAAPADSEVSLLLGPGVTVSGISGHIYVYPGATVSGITGGYIYVYPGATVSGITGGHINVRAGATVSGVTDGLVVVFTGATATGVTGGRIAVSSRASVRVPADIELHQDPRNPRVFFNGADEDSSTLVIDVDPGGELIRG